ncbi:MAG: hypothetical protein ABH986_06860, partial [archaeon]
QTCTNTWSVIPTGTIGNTYAFFVTYTPANTAISPQNTSTVNLTIDRQTGCTNGTTRNCTTTANCAGTQTCVSNSWGTCNDTAGDNCPCVENWSCTSWSACVNGTQTRTCTDNSSCGTTNNKPFESQSCTECTSGATRNCITSQACSGTQTCVSGMWSLTCVDNPNDNCPPLTCAEGQITSLCECGGSTYSTGYCCAGTYRTTPCPTDCSEGQITTQCYCDGTLFSTGYCCSDSHQTTQCSCTENWVCGTWSSCLNGSQSRTCNDTNSCGTILNRPSLTQSCGECTNNTTQGCTTNAGCSGTQLCSNNTWGSCTDTPGDSCPACTQGQISSECYCDGSTRTTGYCCSETYQATQCVCTESWTCSGWSSCSNGTQTRTCTDSSSCETTENIPSLTQACGDCTTGNTQSCTTSLGCSGTQSCVNASWGSCIDIAGDNCPTTIGPITLKELTIMIDPAKVLDGERLTVTVLNENGSILQNARVSYSTKTYYTNAQGKVTLEAKKDYLKLSVSAADYRRQTIDLDIITVSCGNKKCETPYETLTSCPTDCETTAEELIITTTIDGSTLIVKVTDSKQNPIDNAEVTYGKQTKYTNSAGTTTFKELQSINDIIVSKEDFEPKTISYVASAFVCVNDMLRVCETEEKCSGTQTCSNNAWGLCEDIENDSCPVISNDTANSITTTVLAVILVIGIIILVITKMTI